MKYDKKRMILTELTESDKSEIVNIVKDILYLGFIDYHNKYVMFWLDQSGFNADQRLLLGATAMPQRLLMSVLEVT